MIGSPAQRRVVLTFLDQGLSSLSNFATGIVVARLSGAAEFGDYMLVLMVWLVAVGLHRSLISEPLIVVSPGVVDQRKLVAAGLNAELLLGLLLSALVGFIGLMLWAGGGRLGFLMVALAPCLVPLLVQDYWRAVAFQQQRPALALANDAVFAVVQALATVLFVVAGWRSASAILLGWGAGATAGAIAGFWRFQSIGGRRDGWHLLKRFWPFSRWMVADFATAFASGHAYVLFVALLLPRTEYGGFRAAFSLIGPMVVIFLAGGNIGLPEASRRSEAGNRADLQRFTRQLTLGTAGCVAAGGLIVALAAGKLLELLYGPAFSRFGPLVGLAVLHYIIAAFAFGPGIALKAIGSMRHLWRARVTVSIVTLASTLGLVRLFGTLGAGWAGVANAAMLASWIFLIYRSQMRKPTDGADGVPASTATGRPDWSPLT